MDIQFYGANCLSLSYKTTRIVLDDNLKQLGKKNILRNGDVALYTTSSVGITDVEPRLIIDSPGEYEVSDISINGIEARAHTDESGTNQAVMYKISVADINLLITGHIFPELNDNQLEAVGMIDVLVIPVGGHGYTLDPKGALTIIKELEPKLIIPTHYDDKSLKFPVPQMSLAEALSELGMEPREPLSKLRLKAADLSEVTQLVVLKSD